MIGSSIVVEWSDAPVFEESCLQSPINQETCLANLQGTRVYHQARTLSENFAGDNLNLNPPFLTVGFQTVRVVDASNRSYSVVGEMQQPRWYPSVVTMADGNQLIVGGIQQV